MARSAVLIPWIRHVVTTRLRRNALGGASESWRPVVTFQAQRESRGPLQQARIGGTMRNMASFATVHTSRSVLKHKRPTLVGVALQAGLFVVQPLIHHPGTPGSPPRRRIGSVRIVAVTTCHESFIDAMFEGHRKLRADIGMALVAKIHLFAGQQGFRSRRLMNRMTVGADNVRSRMFRPTDVGSRQGLRMASETAIDNLAWILHRKSENLALVSTPFDVFFGGSVARFATLFLRRERFVHRTFVVRIAKESGSNVGMASAARLTADKAGLGIRRRQQRRQEYPQ